MPDIDTGGVPQEKVFLKNSEISQKHISIFLIKLQAWLQAYNFIKETLTKVFSSDFVKFLRTLFLTEHLGRLLLILV